MLRQGGTTMNNIMIIGDIGTGKTTLVHRLLSCMDDERGIYGFRTEKVTNGDKYCDIGHVYLYPAVGEKMRSQDNCIADLTGNKHYIVHHQVFETLGVKLLSDIPENSLVIMDEIGFLESQAPQFCAKIMNIINSKYTVIGIMKPYPSPLLHQIRNRSDTVIHTLTVGNRDLIYETLRTQIIREDLYKNKVGKPTSAPHPLTHEGLGCFAAHYNHLL